MEKDMFTIYAPDLVISGIYGQNAYFFKVQIKLVGLRLVRLAFGLN